MRATTPPKRHVAFVLSDALGTRSNGRPFSASTGADILARVRAETGEAHRRLEARLDIVEATASEAGRRRLVERFYGLHAGAERVLSPLLSSVVGLGYAERRRGEALESDLTALGHPDPGSVPICPLAAPASVAEALGLLYVLEGSTLGGKIIRRRLQDRGQAMTGLSFLDPYGSRTGAQWRAFLAVLHRESPPGDPATGDQVIEGGLAGFRHAEEWLCRSGPS